MSQPIYEEDGENEFATNFGKNDASKAKLDYASKRSHVHLAIPRWVLIFSLIVVVLGTLCFASWKMGWLDKIFGWYSGATVTVTAVEKDSRRAVAGAQVLIGEKSGQTNAQGVAEIKDLRSGAVTITITKAGYTTKTYFTTIYRGINPLPDVIVEKAPDKQYVFKVTVKDVIAGIGIKAAKVLVGKTELTTPESGVVSANVKELVESVHVTKDGFEPMDMPMVFEKETYRDLVVELFPIKYIVFEQEKGGMTDLFTTDFKGSVPVKLTNGNGQYSNSSPKLSQDLKYLAFLSNRDSLTSNNARASILYLMDEKGVVTKATDDLNPKQVQWASSSTLVYYYDTTTSGVVQPTVISYNVTTKKRLVLSQTFVDPAQNINLTHLSIASDGLSVAYAISALNSGGVALELTGIYTVKTDSSSRKQISKTTKTITDMYFTTDGAVKYSFMDASELNSYLASLSGEKDVTKSPTTRERAYTKTSTLDRNLLTVTTKAGLFVYIDTKNGKSDVFSSSADGKTESQLTNLGAVSTITLSADEKYVLVTDSSNVLYVCGLSSTNAVKLADAFNRNASFVFKPPALATP